MKKENSKVEYIKANTKMEKLLLLGEQKGFNTLTSKEKKELQTYTNIVHSWEEKNIIIPLPQTLQGILELKMYEKKLKQKELAKLLHTSPTQLNEVIHKKRKPTINLLKTINETLGIDGNILLKLAY